MDKFGGSILGSMKFSHIRSIHLCPHAFSVKSRSGSGVHLFQDDSIQSLHTYIYIYICYIRIVSLLPDCIVVAIPDPITKRPMTPITPSAKKASGNAASDFKAISWPAVRSGGCLDA